MSCASPVPLLLSKVTAITPSAGVFAASTRSTEMTVLESEAARKFLMDELTLSEPMAQQEADRYAFKSPGQAVAYLYGYTRMRELRMKAEIALGARFDQRAFHDLVLEQGLLPPRLLERAVLEELARR